MLDFGAWADGDYALPAEGTGMTEEEIDQIEKAMQKKAEDERNVS